MTTPNDHDRFDHALRGAICEGAPETAPADLRARVTTALEARPGQPWTRSSAWLLGAAAGVAALLVVAIAWPRITHGPGASAGRSASLPTADGTQPGTAFPTRTGLSLGELVDHPGEVQSGQLITSTDGVVTNTDGRVLMTATGGTTWRDITPGNAGEQAVLRLFFLDPDRGWIVTFDPTAVTGIVVWRTVDGGRSWDETAIPALRSVNWDLEMLSPTVGWLASDPGGEAPKPELRWTHDGGATWSDPIDLAAPARRSTLDNISFFDERNGVATGNETLLATRDGGGTWNITQDNDIGDGIFAGTPPKPSYGPVHLLDGLRGFVVVRWLRADGSEQIRSIRETEDAGRSWTTRYVDEGRRSWAFIDPSRWVGTDGERVWTTADGGSTFSVSSSTGLPVVLDSANLQFVDELNGWAVATGGPPCKSFGCPARFFVLFKTADGGATWAPVGDCGPGTIASCPSPRPS